MATRRDWFEWSLLTAARLILGGVLFYSGFMKLGNPGDVAETIGNFKILPGMLERLMAIALPWNEVVVGAMLILTVLPRTAALLAGMFFAVFAIAVTSAIVRKIDISCGCFGKASATPLGLKTLAIDFGGIALALFIFLKSPASKKSKSRWT